MSVSMKYKSVKDNETSMSLFYKLAVTGHDNLMDLQYKVDPQTNPTLDFWNNLKRHTFVKVFESKGKIAILLSSKIYGFFF